MFQTDVMCCVAQVRGGKLATAEGVSYLEAKHLLLLHYCINIVFYLLLKAEGRPVRDHPVIARLLELRAYLEKIRPIDKKLQYQMEKLLMVAQLQVRHPWPPISSISSPSPLPTSSLPRRGQPPLTVSPPSPHFSSIPPPLLSPPGPSAFITDSSLAASS